jgi:hypothetical protein
MKWRVLLGHLGRSFNHNLSKPRIDKERGSLACAEVDRGFVRHMRKALIAPTTLSLAAWGRDIEGSSKVTGELCEYAFT